MALEGIPLWQYVAKAFRFNQGVVPPDIICGRVIAAVYSGQRGIIDMLHS